MSESPDAAAGFEDVETAFVPRAAPLVAALVGFRLTFRPPSSPEGEAPPPRTVDVEPNRPSRVLVGQSPSCDVQVDDAQVSRRHLGVDVVRGFLRVRDLDSTNGTYVNGLRVVDAMLRGGEQLVIGGTTIGVEAVRSQAAALEAAGGFGRLVGASEAMRRLYPLCKRLAQASVPVVIEGETGTGKEVLAESLHEMGPRSHGPFVVFDCTTVAPNLVEAALFGHEKGSFTGATQTQPGVFERADGGTLLLDEIGDLGLPLQAKLLRALERSEVQRVGGRNYRKVDVRVLAATRRDLDREVQAGRFRDDLYFRLAVARIELPPLRERNHDLGLLARHFWRQLGSDEAPDEDFISRLKDYRWPGNVRELHNAVARRVALGDLETMGSARPRVRYSDGASTDFIDALIEEQLPLPMARRRVVTELERRYVTEVLDRCGGNVAEAAASSGIARRYFQLIRARSTKGDGAKGRSG